MNEYTLMALALDFGIIYYLCKIYGKYILNRKKISEIAIITLSIATIMINTLFSTTDFVTLIVSTITAIAIAVGNHLIFRKFLEEPIIMINLQEKLKYIKKLLH